MNARTLTTTRRVVEQGNGIANLICMILYAGSKPDWYEQERYIIESTLKPWEGENAGDCHRLKALLSSAHSHEKLTWLHIQIYNGVRVWHD